MVLCPICHEYKAQWYLVKGKYYFYGCGHEIPTENKDEMKAWYPEVKENECQSL